MGRPLMRRHEQIGLTVIELVVALALSAMVIGPMVVILNQFFVLPIRASSTHNLIHQAQRAAFRIAEDSRNASSFVPAPAPDYGTFSWVDRTGTTVGTHSVRYFHSSGDNTLVREEIVNGGAPITIVVSRSVRDHSDVSIQRSDGLILASVTASTGLFDDPASTTAKFRARLRPSPPEPQPTPPPRTLAWDDFESGDFSGGSGWLGTWLTLSEVSIESAESPFEGTFHMRLRRSPARAERSLDLSGQIDVRLQFRAKSVAFEPGETVTLKVSDDLGGSFVTVRTWVDGEDDNIYHFEDIDLSSFTMTSEFFIAFESGITGAAGFFFVDDLRVVSSWSG